MEAQDSGNGKGSQAQSISQCDCAFCQDNSQYWQAFSHLMDALAAMLIQCINQNHVQAFEWLVAHTEAVFQAAREQLEQQRDTVH